MQKRPNLLNSFFLLTHMWVNNYTVIVDYIVKCTTSSSLLQYTFEKIKCMVMMSKKFSIYIVKSMTPGRGIQVWGHDHIFSLLKYLFEEN